MTVLRSLLAGTDSGLVPLGDHTGRGWAGLLTSGAEASIIRTKFGKMADGIVDDYQLQERG